MENERRNAEGGSGRGKEESKRWNIKSRTRKKEAEEAMRKVEGGK